MKELKSTALIVGAVGLVGYGLYMYFQGRSDTEEDNPYKISLSKPTATPEISPPGEVSIVAAVMSNYKSALSLTVLCQVYEGAAANIFGMGTLLSTETQYVTISPGKTVYPIFTHQSGVTSNGDRDVRISVKYQGSTIKIGEWEDVFKVIEDVTKFKIENISAYPKKASPGQVKISVPITSESNITKSIAVRCLVYEGVFDIIWGKGDLLSWEDKFIDIPAYSKRSVDFIHNSEYRSQKDRDVLIQVWYDTGWIQERFFTDVFEVLP